MPDLGQPTDAKLTADLFESYLDLEHCKQCLSRGITSYGGVLTVAERIDIDLETIHLIEAEQKRRKERKRG